MTGKMATCHAESLVPYCLVLPNNAVEVRCKINLKLWHLVITLKSVTNGSANCFTSPNFLAKLLL
jgi:hypothetical protein